MLYKKRDTCRICNSNKFQSVLNLGSIYPSDFIDMDKIPNHLDKVPLHLIRCLACDLVQLEHTVDQDTLYRQYWYQSSLNASMVKALKEITDSIEQEVELTEKDLVIDIGCNDGTLLSQYTKPVRKIGVDPAKNLADKASAQCEFYNTYFPISGVTLPKAKVITSIAMFYDLEDPNAFVKTIKENLSDDGIWVVQFTDLLSMFKVNAFDNIVHEHLEYYSFYVLYKLFWDNGLQIYKASTNDVNGGSVRAYVCHKGVRPVDQSVSNLTRTELEYLHGFSDPFFAFGERVRDIKHKTIKLITDVNNLGYKVFVLGASTKGNTLLQYFGLSEKQLPFAGEVNSDKYGLKTVGSNIPIISESEAIKKNPDYFLVLPWHFSEMLIKVHKDYLSNGGKFILPMPEFKVVP